MSDSESVHSRLAALILPLLREWAVLREHENRVIRQLAEVLESEVSGQGATGDRVRDAVPPPGAPVAGAGAGAEPAATPGDAGGGAPDVDAVRPRAAAAPADAPGAEHAGDRAWIDRTIDAVLHGVFSADPEPTADELPAIDLLLMRSGETWVGVPWDDVAGLGLSDDAGSRDRPAPLSLRAVLAMEGRAEGQAEKGEEAAEPYCVTWRTAAGPRTLCCEVLGGVVAAPTAVRRGADLIWTPEESATGGRLRPLVEYFATKSQDQQRAGDEREKETHGEPRDIGNKLTANALQDSPASEPEPVSEPPSVADLPVSIEASEPPASASTSAAPSIAANTPDSQPVPTARDVGPGVVDVPGAGISGRAEGPSPPTGVRRTPSPVGRAALVSVRYLPARVAISRALRTSGWFVLEAADPDELPDMLRKLPHTVVFTETPERPAPGWMDALGQARDTGARVISVSSRVRGAANNPLRVLGDLPRLLYPFQEAELERILESPLLSDGN